MEAATPTPVIQSADLSGGRFIRLVLLLGALTAFGPMSIDMYLPAFPQISRDLGISAGTVQLSVSAFLFGSAAGQLLYGPLADRVGRRLPLLFGLSLYIVATVGCACVGSGTGLLFWRLVMAVGGGAGMVISRAVVRDLYDTAEAARMFSLLMLVMGAAPILAPVVGGQLLLITGWRGIFALLSLFGLASLGATFMALPESLPPERRIRSSLAEMTASYGRLLRNGYYLRHAVALGCVAGVTFSYISGASFFFIELHGATPQQFGLLFGANAIGLIGASQVNRRLLRRFCARGIMKTSFAVTAGAGGLLVAMAMAGIGGFLAQALLIFVCVCMTGFLYPNLTALTLAPFGRGAGSASALLGTIQYTIGASAGALVGLFHDGTALPMIAVLALSAFTGWLMVSLSGRAAPH
jgi:DHA1 family bicyclomycin/chloramphenicol resistance-like MFS transporter